MYESAGVTPDREVLTYCQGGYRAAHSYIALSAPRLSARPQLRRARGRNGETGRICRSKCRKRRHTLAAPARRGRIAVPEVLSVRRSGAGRTGSGATMRGRHAARRARHDVCFPLAASAEQLERLGAGDKPPG